MFLLCEAHVPRNKIGDNTPTKNTRDKALTLSTTLDVLRSMMKHYLATKTALTAISPWEFRLPLPHFRHLTCYGLERFHSDPRVFGTVSQWISSVFGLWLFFLVWIFVRLHLTVKEVDNSAMKRAPEICSVRHHTNPGGRSSGCSLIGQVIPSVPHQCKVIGVARRAGEGR